MNLNKYFVIPKKRRRSSCFEFHDCLDLSWVWFDAILAEGVANVTDLLGFCFLLALN